MNLGEIGEDGQLKIVHVKIKEFGICILLKLSYENG